MPNDKKNLQPLLPMFRKLFAEWHKTKRAGMGFSISQMGELLGVSKSTIGHYETARNLPEDIEFYIECVNDLERTLKG